MQPLAISVFKNEHACATAISPAELILRHHEIFKCVNLEHPDLQNKKPMKNLLK